MLQRFTLILSFVYIGACAYKTNQPIIVSSPNGEVKVAVNTDGKGRPFYVTEYAGKTVLDSSFVGFELAEFPNLRSGLKIISSKEDQRDVTWEQPWGEERFIRDNCKQLTVALENVEGVRFDVIFRVFDDGLAFRYHFPEQEKLKEFRITEEVSEFNFTEDLNAWWIPAYGGNRYEYEYSKDPISQLEKVHTPVTLESTSKDLFVSVHEAALYDYPSMVLKGDGEKGLNAELVPYSTKDETKAYLKAPFSTPWRTIQLAEKPGDLITNYMILNLNEPSKIEDVSWINPGKYIGVWWEMFVNIGTWHQGPKHAANTANVKKYIDFASSHGFNGVLVEGWNHGWDGNWMGGGTKFEFTKPYPDYDVEELSKYAKERDVYIIGHHETGADIENYEEQLEDAYAFLQDYGMKTVKTGYVENGDTLPNGLYHHGQAFVKHFQKVIEMAAKYKTMVVAHEPIKDTGKRRTYPNMVSREGAKGQEYNAMGGNGPSHVTVLPFTRGLSGPMDYTPGVFDIKIKTNPGNQVLGTLARELALYLVIYAPMQMANDLPHNYEGHPAFQFIKDVPTDWETTKVLNAEIGEHITVARQERNSENWFLGTITNEKAREVNIKFDFLPEGSTYTATVYRNSDDADYMENPTGYSIEKIEVTPGSDISLQLCRGGGAAISLYPI